MPAPALRATLVYLSSRSQFSPVAAVARGPALHPSLLGSVVMLWQVEIQLTSVLAVYDKLWAISLSACSSASPRLRKTCFGNVFTMPL